MDEIWLTIKEFPSYMVSSIGRVLSKERYTRWGDGSWHHVKGRIMKQKPAHNGYMQVDLIDELGKRHTKSVHRLVAETFIPNLMDKPCVNHINEDRKDNNMTNLEWVTYRENNNFGMRNKKISNALKGRKKSESYILKRSKPVVAFDPQTGLIIGEFQSGTMAERYGGFSKRRISECCLGKHKTHRGIAWCFKDTFSSTYKQKT